MPRSNVSATWPIGKKLLLIVVFVFLSAGVVITGLGLQESGNLIDRAKKDTSLYVQSLTVQQEQIAVGTKYLLSTLARFPAVERLEADTCNAFFREIKEQNPFYSVIGAATPDGNLFASSTPMESGSVNLSDRKHFRDVVRTLNFSAGEFIVGRVSKVQSINFAYPVMDSDKNLVAVLIAGFKLDEYAGLIAGMNLPEGSVVSVVDHKGTRLFRFPHNSGIATGSPVSEGLFRVISGKSEQGILEGFGKDGVKRIYSFKRLRLTENSPAYLYMMVGVPRDRITEDAFIKILTNLLILAIVGMIAMALTWALGDHMITQPIKQLVTAAQSLGEGRMGTRTDLPHTSDELGRLARSFDDMASLLEKKNIERTEAEEALSNAYAELEKKVKERTADLTRSNTLLSEEIIERKRLEEILVESEKKFKSLFQLSPEAIVLASFEGGQACEVNEAGCRLFGYSREEIIGKNALELGIINSAEFDALRAILASEGRLGDFECRLRTKSGEELTALMSVEALVMDSQPYSLVVMRDISDRKLAEDALREGEKQIRRERALLRALIDSIPDLIFFKDKNSVFLGCNKAFEIYSGMDESELIGKTDLDIAPRETAEFYRGKDREMFAAGKSQHNEEWIPFKDGGGGHFDTLKTPYFGPDGEVLGLIGVSRDLTDRKRMEEAIRKRLVALTRPLDVAAGIEFEELFDLEEIQKLQDHFAEATGVASIITHVDGTPITKPSNFCELCGTIIRGTEKGLRNCYYSDSVIGRHNSEGPIVQPCLSGGLWDAGASITVGGRHIANWLIGQVRDGTQEEARMSAYAREIGADEKAFMDAFQEVPSMSREQFNKVAQALFILAGQLSSMAYQNIQQARFITEQKKAEEERIRLVTAIEQVADGIMITDANWIIQYANPAFERITGYAESEIIGRHARILKSDKYGKSFYKKIRESLSRGDVWSGRVQSKKKDGTLFYVEALTSPVKDETGRIANYISIRRDVTHEVRLERELRQSQKMESIGTLAGGIAHDFNNILAAIMGFTEVALRKIPEESPIRANLERVLNAGSRAADLVKQILAFSRQTEQERIPVRVGPIVEEVMKLLRSSLPTTVEIRQEIKTGPGGGLVLADPTQLHQVLMNLCANAAHAMRDRGGTLSVKLSEISDASLVPSHPDLSAGPCVCLTVSDTGHGMGTSVMERIFDPYFTTKGPGEGTGLGLSVVQGIVKSCGGAITVYSEREKGTVFKVFLPKYEEEVAAEARAAEELPTGTERILFVDDEKALVDLGKEMLQALGYSVTARTNSLEALEAFREQPFAFDLVVTDMTMPGLTGSELARELMAIRINVPVVLSTGFSDLIDEGKIKEEGIRELLMKPYAIAVIAKTIRRALDEG